MEGGRKCLRIVFNDAVSILAALNLRDLPQQSWLSTVGLVSKMSSYLCTWTGQIFVKL